MESHNLELLLVALGLTLSGSMRIIRKTGTVGGLEEGEIIWHTVGVKDGAYLFG